MFISSLSHPSILQSIKPYGRAVRFHYQYRQSVARARTAPIRTTRVGRPPVFILGCGRSGTTLLGRLLSMHDGTHYLCEPYHLWAAVDPLTDAIKLYTSGTPRAFMDASHANAGARRRFDRLLARPAGASASDVVVEKSPINTLRIGYLEALAPGARYIHIVRDGVDVARSIDRLAVTNEYKIAGRPDWNQWWGAGDAKWSALARDASAAGYYPDEVMAVEDDLQRGAYEWLTSVREVDRWRDHLGSRLLEFTYEDLTSRPTEVLRATAGLMDLEADEAWLEAASREVGPERHNEGRTVRLPRRMATDFNRLQRRYDFASRAVPMSAPVESPRVNHAVPSWQASGLAAAAAVPA